MIEGRIWKFGNNVNTDVIFAGKYTYTVIDQHEIASHAMEDALPGFSSKVRPNDIIVAGKNFGCGSSREQAVFCLKYAGIGAIIAASFSRIYFRNAINAGLPVIVQKELVDHAVDGQMIRIDFTKGLIDYAGREYSFPALPGYILNILSEGGLNNYIKKKLANKEE